MGENVIETQDLTVYYGDPPPNSPPILSNIQQEPLSDDVGYPDPVTVSVDIETYAPIITAQIQYTDDFSTSGWMTYEVASLADSGVYGLSTWYGTIPAVEAVGTTITYRIYVENEWESEVLSTTSGNYEYTTIDNIAPNIIHQNNSTVVDIKWKI